jgi:two-component system, chemotaxis family, chemotaxis protein CheY
MPAAASLEVLVVDDQKSMRALVLTSLAELGFQHLRECTDGVEALHELRARPAHLVISDMTMPRMDGLGLLSAVRDDARLAKTAFILLTSRGEMDLVKQAIALGVNNYVRKPFSLSELKKKVEAVVGVLT